MELNTDTPATVVRYRAHASLLIIPIALFFVAVIMADANGPYSDASNSDPDYCYLVNSLNILMLHAPGHTDHPGTTLQVLGAVAVFSKWLLSSLFGNWAPLERAVLTSPESYINAIHLLIVLLLAATVFTAGSRMYRISGSLAAGLVAQATVFAFRETLVALPRTSPEPLLLAAGFALMVPVISIVAAKGQPAQREATTLGVLVGFGVITKITFLPLVVFAGVLKSWKERARFAVTAVIALLAFGLPIVTTVPAVGALLSGILTHRGKYGSGPAGAPSSAELLTNLQLLYNDDPFVFYWLTFYVGALLAVHLSIREPEERTSVSLRGMLVAGCACIAMQIAMSVKHFAPQYILPCLASTSLLNGLLVAGCLSRRLPRALRTALLVCGGLLLFGSIHRTYSDLDQWMTVRPQIRDGAAELSQKRAEAGACLTIGYYRSSAPGYALDFANGYSALVHAKVLEELYPNSIMYNIFTRQFLSFTRESRERRVREMLAQGRCVLMQGVGREVLPAEFSLQRIDAAPNGIGGDGEILYKLVAVSAEGALPVAVFEPPANAITVEAENFSHGNVVVENTHWGLGIGVVVTPTFPAYAEYTFPAPEGMLYDVWMRYASNGRRPLTLSINGTVVTTTACSEPTDGLDPQDQEWQKVGLFALNKGNNTLRVDSVGPFPHLDKTVFVPAKERPIKH